MVAAMALLACATAALFAAEGAAVAVLDRAADAAAAVAREIGGHRYALKRPAKAREIAAAILFLTSDEASFVTGFAFPVDGGRTFH